MLIFVIWENRIFISVILFSGFHSYCRGDFVTHTGDQEVRSISGRQFMPKSWHRWSCWEEFYIDFALNFQIPNWFHFSCFFRKHKAKTYHDISGFDSLRWDDQEKIKRKVGGGGGSKSSEPAASSSGSDDLMVEYAKSSRSKCKKCKDQIDKVRLHK